MKQSANISTTKTFDLWQRAQRERKALREATPGWDNLPREERDKLWKQHLNSLYPDIHEQYDEITYACWHCKDARYVMQKQLKSDNSIEYTTIPCPYCGHLNDKDRLTYVGVPPPRQDETLDNFKYVAGSDNAFQAALQLGRGESEWKLLLIYGPHGNGKTHLARGAMMEARARGLVGRYYTVRQLMASLREAMDKEGESADAIILALKEIAFLVIDELGTEDPRSDWQAGVLEDIVNYRYDNELPTVLVRNGDIIERSDKTPQGLSPAIASRLKDSQRCLRVHNSARDFRPSTLQGKRKGG